jgi:hypothetical protein
VQRVYRVVNYRPFIHALKMTNIAESFLNGAGIEHELSQNRRAKRQKLPAAFSIIGRRERRKA